jgi:hypothetical protein
LFNSQINGDNLGDAEECALKDGVGAPLAKAIKALPIKEVIIIKGDTEKLTGNVGRYACQYLSM